jgi:hypothetical protein
MKLIGIDIAIENLAFCTIDYDRDTNKHTIKKEEWFVLDTTPEDFKQECEYENRKKCGKDAGWFYTDKDAGIYRFYCATHKKLVDPEKSFSWKTLNKNYLNNNDVIRSIFKKLDEHLELFRSADYIIIEKQPPKNPKMISIMNYLYSYLVIRLWNDVNNHLLKDIVFADAKNKVNYCLTILDKSEVDEIQKKYNPVKNKYQYYKKTSILTVKKQLASYGDTELLEYFNSYKKIDDLADSRNMVLWWIENVLLKQAKKDAKKEKKLKEKEEKALNKLSNSSKKKVLDIL